MSLRDPLAAKPIDRSFDLRLQGNMARYEWPINGVIFDTAKPGGQAAQVRVKKGQRVAVKFINETGMSHPMHLHGHSFQVIEINGKRAEWSPSRHHSRAAKDERHRGLRCKQSRHMVFALPHSLASGCRHGDVSAVRGVRRERTATSGQERIS